MRTVFSFTPMLGGNRDEGIAKRLPFNSLYQPFRYLPIVINAMEDFYKVT
nr:hypothetical protein [Evansella caseinilytica]